MTNVMTPSMDITAGQVGKLQELLGARLRKSGLQSEPVQQVLGNQGDVLADEMVAAIRKRVEAVSDMIVRRVKVDRTRLPQQVLNATGRKQYTDKSVVAGMPGKGDQIGEEDVFFFPLKRFVSDDELEKEYELRGFRPDPYAQSAVNEADPTFADEHPNGTHWKDTNGNWCFAAFDRWGGERGVSVDRYDYGWYGSWWFAGVRK